MRRSARSLLNYDFNFDHIETIQIIQIITTITVFSPITRAILVEVVNPYSIACLMDMVLNYQEVIIVFYGFNEFNARGKG